MKYAEAIKYVKDTGKFGSKLGLDVMNCLLGKMGNPERKFKVVHIAGTNGKGSTSSYISHVLTESGCKTGLFTSPPIIDETERIQIDGDFISREKFAEITEYVKSFADTVESEGLHYPTEFELFTAIAFEYFARSNVDIAVIEVGLGGSLDATNVCIPAVSVLTAIDFDHTQWLGNTIEEIAATKSGIIKKNVPVVLYPEQIEAARRTVAQKAKENDSILYDTSNVMYNVKYSGIDGSTFDYDDGENAFNDVNVSLVGVHQIKNCITAIKALLVLRASGYKISDEAIYSGIKKTKWPGRFEVVQKKPFVIFDGGHNEQCMRALASCVDTYLKPYYKILVFSMFADKDCEHSIAYLNGRFDYRIVTEMKNPRRATAEYIKSKFDESVNIIKEPKEALEEAKKLALTIENSVVVVCGSLNLLEEILA